MSRYQVSNERYTFAFGVDHTPMGTFFQIWDKKIERDEYDTPHAEYDALFGLQIHHVAVVATNQPLRFLLQLYEEVWEQAKQEGRGTNLTEGMILDCAYALGWQIETLERKVHELWD